MQIILKNKTQAVITLNKIGTYLRGLESIVVDINDKACENEVKVLERMGVVEIINGEKKCKKLQEDKLNDATEKEMIGLKRILDEITVTPASKVKEEIEQIEDSKPKQEVVVKRGKGRPKKIQTQPQKKENNESELSEAVIATGSGFAKKKMVKRLESSIEQEDSSAVQESLNEMKKIDEEEKWVGDPVVDENKMDVNQRMRDDVIIVTEGVPTKSKIKKNSTPNSKEIGTRDPFIDRKQENPKDKDAFIENKDEDEYNEAFIEK